MKKYTILLKIPDDITPYKILTIYAKNVLINKKIIEFYNGIYGLPTYEKVAAFNWDDIYGFVECEAVRLNEVKNGY